MLLVLVVQESQCLGECERSRLYGLHAGYWSRRGEERGGGYQSAMDSREKGLGLGGSHAGIGPLGWQVRLGGQSSGSFLLAEEELGWSMHLQTRVQSMH